MESIELLSVVAKIEACLNAYRHSNACLKVKTKH